MDASKRHSGAPRGQSGFTLMELLIVVAIIGVLTAVALPTFGNQLSNARRAADEANARTAYASAMAQYMADGMPNDAVYVFDASRGVAVNLTSDPTAVLGIGGYGQWEREADYDVAGVGVYGVANEDGVGQYVAVTFQDGKPFHIIWDGGDVYTKSTPRALQNASPEQRKAFDDLVLQSLADRVAKMTVSELSELAGQDITKVMTSSNFPAYFDKNGACIATIDQWYDADTGQLKARIYGSCTDLFSDMGYITEVTQGDFRTGVFSENGEIPFYSIGTGNNVGVFLKLETDGDEITKAEVWLSDYGRYKDSYKPANRDNYYASSTK